ncbi:vWA domain-containing protein [Egicoccus halophilus]|uniref:VWA domain-containing protein n=1 Tax=Egicoccus halophilus TaxID=1670830 RepID=A0A8J3ETK1_9ACTN|nr:VWA domain-containing protein [Egicoccus halophilus]GGI09798.1 VWA domain-containing protein [Egicoccus halophilus]
MNRAGDDDPGARDAGETARVDAAGDADGADHVAALAAGLRTGGVEVGGAQVTACARALVEVAPDDVDGRYWAGRVTLCSRPGDVPVYDRVFTAVLRGGGTPPPSSSPAETPVDPSEEAQQAGSDRPGGAGGDPPDDDLRAGGVAMAHERLRHRRFDRLAPDERAEVDRLVAALPVALPARRTRRRRPGRGEDLDLARTLDRAMSLEGEVLEFARLVRRQRARPLVLLLDVSGSMAPYARPLLRLAVAAGAGRRRPRPRVEVFAFGTRLTRLTDVLDARDPDAALAEAAARVVDWDGGTRIGASLDRLVRDHGRRGLLRGAVAVVCSDGLERGATPEALAASVGRLRRSVHRLVWVNPLAGDPRYTPTQRGMAAALPHLDVFLPGHDLGSLEDLVAVLATLR